MYSDNTLTPKEAVRMCALGTLARGPMRYSALAYAARHFMSRVTGPSLELMMSSLELLKFEGLIEPLDGQGMEDDATFYLTESGEAEFKKLLTAKVRAGSSDLNKLVITLKFRFLDRLDPEERCIQIDALVDGCQAEISRLADLREHLEPDDEALADWLDHDLDLLERRLDWLESKRNALYSEAFPD